MGRPRPSRRAPASTHIASPSQPQSSTSPASAECPQVTPEQHRLQDESGGHLQRHLRNLKTVNDLDDQSAVDGGDGTATMKLSKAEEAAVTAAADRTASNPNSDRMTGAELDAGPGFGIVDDDGDVAKPTPPSKSRRK